MDDALKIDALKQWCGADKKIARRRDQKRCPLYSS